MKLIIFSAILSVSIYAVNAGQPEPAPKVNKFVGIGYYNECESKHAANYTWVFQFTRDSDCSWQSGKVKNTFQALVQCNAHSHEGIAVNSMQALGYSYYPSGAYSQAKSLTLITGGPLQGKYIYLKSIYLEPTYLKKCSSILGNSYFATKSSTLLIADKLDLNVLLSPTGAYDTFIKSCTTVCNGVNYKIPN